MTLTLFSRLLGLTGLIATVLALPSHGSMEAVAQVQPGSVFPTGCRITRDTIGVYQEPNVTDAALGILAKEVTVTLGSGSSDGWARIVAPQTGWVQAKFLRGDGSSVACPQGQASATVVMPPQPTSPSTLPAPVIPTEPTMSAAKPANGVSRAVCTVLPDGGLIVRDQPSLEKSRVIGSIQAGNYTFQFTQRRSVSPDEQGDRQWVYITAPAKGWISTGFGAGGGNLSGEGCL